MKKISTAIIGLSLIASSALFAEGDHKGDHMHEGKMQNHVNANKMNNMNHGNMKTMDHSKMNMPNKSMGAYHNQMMTNGYHVSLSSKKPLVPGNNHMSIQLMKEGKIVTNAKVKIKFFMPEMPGMPYMEYKAKGKQNGNKYNCDVNIGMSGTWQYQLKFKTSDGVIHKTRGSVNL